MYRCSKNIAICILFAVVIVMFTACVKKPDYGKLPSYREYTYDKYNYIVGFTDKRTDKSDVTYTIEYDSDHNIKKVVCLTFEGNGVSEITYFVEQCDPEGMPLIMKGYDEEGDLAGWQFYEYFEGGNFFNDAIKMHKFVDEHDNIESLWRCDDSGNVVEEIQTADNRDFCHTMRTYLGDGTLSNETVEWYDGASKRIICTFVTEYVKMEDGTLKGTTTTYDKDGNMVEHE